MDAILQDVRFALRMIAKSPWFSAVVILVLAIGIGATTAMFSVVDALLLKPLPYRAADRIVGVRAPDPRVIRESATSFETFAQSKWVPFDLLDGEPPERVYAGKISPSYFQVLDGKPLLGRIFAPDEGAPGADQVAILSHGLWHRRFASDPHIIGRNIRLSDKPYTVIGVMPKDRIDDGFPQLWVPSDYEDPAESRSSWGYGVLKPSVDVATANAEVVAIAQRLGAELGDPKAGERAWARPIREGWTRNVETVTLMLFAAMAVLLLIACVNVALLLLARAASQRMEVAIRAALGATPGRIARQLLTQSLVLAIVAGAFGMLLAMWGADLLAAGLLPNSPSIGLVGVDIRAFAFTVLVSFATALGFGLVPAIDASRRDVHVSLKEGGARATASGRKNLARNVLVTSEIALALTLCAGAGVLAKSLTRLASVDPGFDRGASIFQVDLWGARYESPEAKQRFAEAAVEKIRAIPGVTSVVAASHLPMTFSAITAKRADTHGRAPWPPDSIPRVRLRYASPGYISTLGIPLRDGRFFSDHDRAASARVAVVSETMARRFWPGESPIGKRVLVDGKPEAFEVVGLIGDVRDRDVQHEPEAEAVFPLAQHPQGGIMLAVGSTGAHAALRATVRAAMRDIDPQLAIADIRMGTQVFTTLDETLAWGLSLPRLSATLTGLFATTALILAAIGVFGVTAYTVQQRTREIGIRMALGARAADVVRLVLKQSAILALIGIGIGLPVAFVATRALRALVYGMSPTDPIALVGAAVLLAVVTLVASYLPARRATRVSPMLALRAD